MIPAGVEFTVEVITQPFAISTPSALDNILPLVERQANVFDPVAVYDEADGTLTFIYQTEADSASEVLSNTEKMWVRLFDELELNAHLEHICIGILRRYDEEPSGDHVHASEHGQ